MSVCEAVKHYQRSIEKCNGDEERILHCISKLCRLPVSVQHLQDTGIGRTVNGLRKFEGKVAKASKELVTKWKTMVAEEESSESEDDQDDAESEVMSEAGSEAPSDEQNDPPCEPEVRESEIREESPHERQTHKVSVEEEPSETHSSNDKVQVVRNISHSHDDKRHTENSKSSHKSHKRHRDEESEDQKLNKKSKQDHNESSKKSHASSSGSDEREAHRSHHKHKSSSSRKERAPEKSSVAEHKTMENNTDHSKRRSEKDPEHSSSKSKHKSKSHDDRKKKDRHKTSASSSSSTSKEKKDRSKTEKYDEGIGSHSGASFEEALGFASSKSPKKKSSLSKTSSASTSKTTKSPSVPVETPKLLSPAAQLAPLNLDLSIIPTVSPNYRPLPYVEESSRQPKMTMANAVGLAISSKNQRTKVYSGNKGSLTHVPTLYEMCIRLLQENIDAVEYTGGVPYDILRPVLERASPEQLFMLEHHNPYLIEDSDSLWEFHCQKKFRGKPRLEMEGWREMYLRCQDEQAAKLRSITANIKQSQDQSQPVRKVKMAYFDSAVKPPRNVAKKQAQFGTARIPVVTPAARVSALSGINSNIAKAGDARLKIRAGLPDHAQVSATSHKHKRAPLMMKTLSFMKGRYKR